MTASAQAPYPLQASNDNSMSSPEVNFLIHTQRFKEVKQGFSKSGSDFYIMYYEFITYTSGNSGKPGGR